MQTFVIVREKRSEYHERWRMIWFTRAILKEHGSVRFCDDMQKTDRDGLIMSSAYMSGEGRASSAALQVVWHFQCYVTTF